MSPRLRLGREERVRDARINMVDMGQGLNYMQVPSAPWVGLCGVHVRRFFFYNTGLDELPGTGA